MLDRAAVLYSGGVDSTLVASRAAQQARKVYLLTCVTMAHRGHDQLANSPENMLPGLNMLREKYVDTEFVHVVLDARALHRHLWRRSRLEMFKIGLWANLPCATCNPAIFARALVFCLRNGVEHLYGGHNVMMSCYPYQHPRCVEKVGEFARSFGVEVYLPVFWYENEDVMMLFGSEEFSGDDTIRSSIRWGQSTSAEARDIGLVKGEVKIDFEQKNRPQMVCLQDCFVNYAMLLFFLPRYGIGKMTELMLKHWEMQARSIRGLIGGHLENGSYSRLFEDR